MNNLTVPYCGDENNCGFDFTVGFDSPEPLGFGVLMNDDCHFDHELPGLLLDVDNACDRSNKSMAIKGTNQPEGVNLSSMEESFFGTSNRFDDFLNFGANISDTIRQDSNFSTVYSSYNLSNV